MVGIFAVLAKENEREEKEGVVGSPSDKRPVGTMPETGQKEDDKSVTDNNPFLVAVGVLYVRRDFRTRTSQRNIHVIAKTKWSD